MNVQFVPICVGFGFLITEYVQFMWLPELLIDL